MSARSPMPLLAVAVAVAVMWMLLSDEDGPSTPGARFTVDRVHDLLTRIGAAEVEGLSVYRSQEQAGIAPDDNRDRAAYLRCRPGAALTFHDLAVGAGARLRFGIGAGHELPPTGSRPVSFRVAVRRARDTSAGAGDDWIPLFERTLAPADLAPPTWWEFHEVALPDDGETATAPGSETLRWSVRFSTHGAGPGPRPEWPVFLAPQLVSAGREVDGIDRPVRRAEVAEDLMARLDDARVDPPGQLSPSVLDAAEGVTIVGGSRVALQTLAPCRASWTLRPTADSEFVADVGMDTTTGWSQPGDGIDFALLIAGETVWEWTCQAPTVRADRGWHPVSVPLSPWAGREVELTLVADPRGDPRNDVGAWAAPRVVQRREVRRRTAGERPDVVVIVADTLRADSLGRGLTPRLDTLAAASQRFVAARSPASWTWPATASLFTGLYPTEHGLMDENSSFLLEGHDTLAEVLQRDGYTTGAFVTNTLIGRRSGFAQGFETFVHTPYLRGRALNDRVAAWLDDTEGTARLLYVHYMDPHAPYKPAPDWLPDDAGDPSQDMEIALVISEQLRRGERDTAEQIAHAEALRRRYDAEVRYLDTAIGELLDDLAARGMGPDTIVVFTADHGEEFLDHGLLSHGGQLYDETLAVPLLLRAPGLLPGTHDQPVATVDLLPTLCDLTGVPAPEVVAGRPRWHADRPPESIFGQTLHGIDLATEQWTEHLSIVRAGYKLIHLPATGDVRLYDLAADPGERHDLADRQPDRAAALLEELTRWRSESAARGSGIALDGLGDALKHMEQLGYVER